MRGFALVTALTPVILGAAATLGAVLLLAAMVASLLVRRVLRPARVLAAHARELAEAGTADASPLLALPPLAVAELDDLRRGLVAIETARRQQAESVAAAFAARDEAEARLRLATAGVGVGTWEIDIATKRLRLSAQAMALLGAEHAMLEAAQAMDLVHPADRAVTEAIVRRAFAEGSPFDLEFRLAAAAVEGDERWLLSRGQIERHQSGTPIRSAGALIEVTARRRAEDALREREARLRLAVEAAGLGSWEVDLRTGAMSRSGRTVPARPGLALSGYTLDDFFARVVHPEDSGRVRAIFNDLIARRISRYRIEYRVRRAQDEYHLRGAQDAGWLWIESYGGVVEHDPVSGDAVRAAGVSRDITERRAAEDALRASEERFRFAIEAAGGVSTWNWDVPQDHVVSDASFAAMFDIDARRAAKGTAIADYIAAIHPDDRERVGRMIEAAIRPGAGDYAAEYRTIGPDGATRWVVARGRCYHDESGRPTRFPGVLVDITARKENEERRLLLAREVDHRAKNVLAVVQSVVALTRDEDPAAFRAAVTGRITAMARAHTLLASQRWDGADLFSILEAELAPHQQVVADTGFTRVRLQGPPVWLRPVAVQPLAMAVHELTTNAVKHGALSTADGSVEVSWVPAGERGLRLIWRERGGATPVEPPSRRGFGSSLVEMTVKRQLGGALSHRWEQEGLVAELHLPAENVQWGRQRSDARPPAPGPGTQDADPLAPPTPLSP